ncbi:MAG: hypothetical protein ACUVTM_07080 [Candidatus Bathyarchaeia archaeon]
MCKKLITYRKVRTNRSLSAMRMQMKRLSCLIEIENMSEEKLES